MSFLETTPLLNTTTVQSHNNQKIISQNTPPMTISYPIFREQTYFTNPPATISGVSNMEKPVKKITWRTSDTVNSVIGEVVLDWSFVREFIAKFGINRQAFANFGNFVITLRRTDMANYQGMSLMAFDPSPAPNYYETLYTVPFATKNDFQLDLHKLVEPKTSEDIVFRIPFNIPFEMLYIFNNSDPLTNYHRFYSFGTIRISVLEPLVTTNAIQSLEYRISAYLEDLQTTGNVFD